MLNGKTATIFGASGFLGRHIVWRLAKLGMTIRVPTRDFDKALTLKPMGDVGQIVPLPVSIRHDASVAKAIGRSDVVINLIGILFERGASTFQSVHVEAAARIARLAVEQGAEYVVHVSALGVDRATTSLYAQSKVAGEQAVRAFSPKATILRPSIMFGQDDHFFNMFSNLARFSPVLPLIGGGATKFQPVYVADVADAVIKSLEHKEAAGKTFELGGPDVYSFRALMELMLKLTDRKRILMNMPWGLASLQASLMQWLPQPPLTRDQIKLLHYDNVVSSGHALTFKDISLTPSALEVILPSYLEPYRWQGVHPTE